MGIQSRFHISFQIINVMMLQNIVTVILSFLLLSISAEKPSVERQKTSSFIGNWFPRYSNSWSPSLSSANTGGLLQGMIGGTQTSQRLVQPLMQGMIGTQFAAPRTSLFSGLLGSLGTGLLGSRGMIGTNILGTGLGTGTYGTYGTNIGTGVINAGTYGTNLGGTGVINAGTYGTNGFQLVPFSMGGSNMLIGQNLRNLLTTFLRPPGTVIVSQYPTGVVVLTTVKPTTVLTTTATTTTTKVATTTVATTTVATTTAASIIDSTIIVEETIPDWEPFLP